MRHQRVIFSFVLITAGCSITDEGGELLEPADSTAVPVGSQELVEDRDPTAEGGGYGILMIDVTSSMNTTRSSTGNTRCEDAMVMAEGIIRDFFDPTGTDGDGLAIWGFANPGQNTDDVQPTSTGYYTDEQSAIDALEGLSCNGSTPLADALCKGVNGDGETFTIDPMLDQLFILTDGFENNSDGPCSGPSGSESTPGTWQYNVTQEMQSTGIKVNSRYWIDPTLLLDSVSIDSFADADYDPSEQELQIVAELEGMPLPAIGSLAGVQGDTTAAAAPLPVDAECDTTCQEINFFKELALMSGGSWGVVADDDADYPNANTTDPAEGPKQPSLDPDPEPSPVGFK